MGLYITHFKSLRDRHPELLALPRPLFASFREEDYDTAYVTEDFRTCSQVHGNKENGPDIIVFPEEIPENAYENILFMADSTDADSLEIVVPDEKALSLLSVYLSDYLKDRELSVGLLVPGKEEGFRFVKRPVRPHGLCAPRPMSGSAPEAPRPKANRKAPECDMYMAPILDESFQSKLFHYLNKSGKTNVEVYTKGGITRQVFSKALNTRDFIPKKGTILCLIIGMELCMDDALDLLNAAGYTLSSSLMTDTVIMEFIRKHEYDMMAINIELNKYGEPLLGWDPR